MSQNDVARKCESVNQASNHDAAQPISSALCSFFISALLHSEMRAAVRTLGEIFHGAAPSKTTDLSRAELAKKLGKSEATISRTIKPTRFVGNSPLYDLADVHAQLAARGKKASTPATANKPAKDAEADVDISSALAAGGMRLVVGGKGKR